MCRAGESSLSTDEVVAMTTDYRDYNKSQLTQSYIVVGLSIDYMSSVRQINSEAADATLSGCVISLCSYYCTVLVNESARAQNAQ